MSNAKSKIALLLLVPAPSLGVLASMVIAPDTAAGKTVFIFSKIWVLLLPVIWLVFVRREKLSLSPPRNGGFVLSAAIGVVVSALIFALYLTIGKQLIEPELVREMAGKVGLGEKQVYLAGAAYWILINSVLEEYLWRWFVLRESMAVMPRAAAISASALFFSLHHIIALQVYFNWFVVAVATLGIFTGALIWSWCYLKFKSIWPGCLSHAVVDLAVFSIGYMLIFG
jgi:membrane protease YdiL (CAAX protease family)